MVIMDTIWESVRMSWVWRIQVLLLLLLASVSISRAQTLRLTVTNPEPYARAGEIVALRWDQFGGLFSSIDRASIAVTTLPEGVAVPVQPTDEELLVQVDLGAGQSREFLIHSGSPPIPPVTALVDGLFALPREDFAWENDRIAFRVYGPALAGEVNNGFDVWTKRVRSLIVQKWYRESSGNPPSKDSYHVDRGEGADFFLVGKSLGAGGAALWSEEKLHQPGVFSAWKIITNGPLRVQFELTYDSIRVNDARYSEMRRITLDAGSNLNRIDVTYRREDAAESLVVACGLVKRPGATAQSDESGCWLSLWGPTTADTTDGYLGTGIVVPFSAFIGLAEDSLHSLILGKTELGTPFTYYAGAGWTRSGDFRTSEDWTTYLSRYSRSIRSPLRVTVMEGTK